MVGEGASELIFATPLYARQCKTLTIRPPKSSAYVSLVMPLYIAPQTLRLLSLSVGTSYLGLGSIYFISPIYTARDVFGVWPFSSSTASSSRSSSKPSLTDTAPRRVVEDCLVTSMYLIGARDLSIGAALVAFEFYGMRKAVGLLIMGGMVTCVTDVMIVWRRKGWKAGTAMGVGAAYWAAVGWACLVSSD